MIYQLRSNDPKNYGEIDFQPYIPWNCNRVKYRIVNFNTFTNILITTIEDYVEIDSVKYYFKDRCSYEIDDLVEDVNSVKRPLLIRN